MKTDAIMGPTLKHYRIDMKLGEGGMGVVYKAHDIRLDRPVSIKVLPGERVASPERKRRFVQEAKAASALNHPNILHIYDIDAAEGVEFIAMEFVDGETLDQLIARKALSLSDAVRYAVQIADALAAAHAKGIVHRDVKPSNIMVNSKGLVKILDFGLAKLSQQVESDPSDPTQSLPPTTKEGAILGTVAYMSPEQVEGKRVDSRSDIFSFGAVLYEMVTGRRAFQGDTDVSTISAILHREPTPIREIPAELESVISRCLRKDPARRIQHMVDVRLALEEILQEPRPHVRTWAWRAPSRRQWALAALVAAVPVVAFLAWQAWRTTRPQEPPRAVALTSYPGSEAYPSLSPDGNYVAFMWTGPRQDNADVYVQMIGAGEPLRLTSDPRADYHPVWSPDGRWIAFLRGQQRGAGQSEVWLIPPLGGPSRKVTDIETRTPGPPGVLTWCPDSTCLVAADSQGKGKPDALFVVSLDSGEKRRLTDPPPHTIGDSNPAISPDGRSLVFRRLPSGHASELYRLLLTKDLRPASDPVRLTPSALNAGYPTWMPNGKEILFSTWTPAGGRLWRMPVSGNKEPEPIPYVGENGLMPVVSRPQRGRPLRLVYTRSFQDTNIWRIDTTAPGVPASSPPSVAISSTQQEVVGDISPDGRRVAFFSSRSGSSEIWLSDLDGSNAVQLTSMGAPMAAAPRWSPDGRMIAFHANPEGQYDIFVIPAAGGKVRRLTSHPANDAVPTFSRDGQWIYFGSARTGEGQIWKIPASGGDAVQVTTSGGWRPIEGFDGASIYYEHAERPGHAALWRIPISGGQPIRLPVKEFSPGLFDVVETGIYYVAPGRNRLQFFDFATERSTRVAENLRIGNIQVLLSASRDGRTILYSKVDSQVDDLMLVENFR